MSKIITTTASRSTFEDSLVPIVLHLARQVEHAETRLKETLHSNEDDIAKLEPNAPDREAFIKSCDASEHFSKEGRAIALRKFRLAYQLAKLEHGELSIVLALANKK